MCGRVAPEPSDLARPFWDGCNAGLLLIQRCLTCGMFIHQPEPECIGCGGTSLTFEAVGGTGRVETFTVIHRSFVPNYRDAVPYVVGWIALPEQRNLRIFSAIVGPESVERVAMDAAVEVRFENVVGFGAIPVFELV
ncbi:OB-fold domain-containing protein [Rhodococcus sp. USK10]|uniref:Zn-ribbon domain-containing OB-fold protein n=1 Tax=Rhodococcus sp. USK10 TaxID=2789739 RepID=UPI001C5D7FD9|nr:OB-fold domain-containing protein [Rhodococcus sp. USK10]QYB07419.1 OB-fold domain-containing protein [Rhodococcus sp. USK10]